MAAAPVALPRNMSRGPDQDLVFSPSPRLRAYHLLLLVLFTWLVLLPLLLVVASISPPQTTLGIVIALLLILLAARWWIPRHWESLQVRFTNSVMIVERGVWRKTRTAVPYARITGIGTSCGIVCRHLGIATLRMRLDDGRVIRIGGVEDAENVRGMVQDLIAGRTSP